MNFKVGLRAFLIVILIPMFSIQTLAQDDIEGLLLGGVEDANILAEGYISPFMKAFGTGLAAGWANTAEAHKSAGFDLTFTANAVFIPDDGLFYTPTFNNVTYDASSPVEQSPTVFGPEDDSKIPVYRYDVTVNGTQFTGTFDGPPGIDLKGNVGMQAIPVPMAQLGIGIIKKTDLKIRWTPKIDVGDDGEFKLIGFAVMHDIKQHIPGIKDLPFDLSALIGFTDMSLEYNLAEATANNSPDASISTNNGKSTFDVNAWTIQGLISKKFSVLTVYGGLGYNLTKSSLKLSGDYDITYSNGIFSETETVTNPLDLNFKQNGPRMTAGFRLKLAILTIHADYTLQKYSTLTAGIGFSVR